MTHLDETTVARSGMPVPVMSLFLQPCVSTPGPITTEITETTEENSNGVRPVPETGNEGQA